MAQSAGNPKIEELRARVKADPKSRLFYPLAEELRKVGQLKEAEDVLISGLASNPTYLSAWVSLGRVLKDLGKTPGAIEALNKALSIDRENIVAARLLAQLYLDAGDKVEAIKKFKFVHALLPTDLEVEAHINQLDRELNPPKFEPIEVSESAGDTGVGEPAELIADDLPIQEAVSEAAVVDPVVPSAGAGQAHSPFMSSDEEHLWQEDIDRAGAPADILKVAPPPVESAPEADPFASQVAGSFSSQEAPSPFDDASRPPVAAADDLTATVTMGDLYAQQGYYDSARDIYTKILAAHPDADEVRSKLDALPAGATADHVTRRDVVVRKLQDWLSKVGGRDAVGRI